MHVKRPVMPRCMSSTSPPDKMRQQILPPPLQPLDLRPAQPRREVLRQRKPQVGPVLIDARERLAFERRLEAAPHDFDFG